MQNTWMIRAGEGGFAVSDFKELGLVAIGWPELGQLKSGEAKAHIEEALLKAYPGQSRGYYAMSASQIDRFINHIKKGDRAVTYDSARRVYHYGTIESDALYDAGKIAELPRYRKVKWEAEISRDDLTSGTKNRLGGISTLFLIATESAEELAALAKGKPIAPAQNTEEPETETEVLAENVRKQSEELIKDRIVRLLPEQMEELVAGLLRAMGYKTRITPKGADRGVDILASRDGFGFEPPRIVVEVKHRKESMGSQEIRSFLGGRHKDDKGLYVSTGGFTKDARYEADRAQIPLTLIDIDALVQAVIEHYENFDNETKRLLPLTKIYWVG